MSAAGPQHVGSENGFSSWGPLPPADFVFNYESPSADLVRETVASKPS